MGTEQSDILLETQPKLVHNERVWWPHIAKMPRFVGDTGYVFFAGRIAEDKTVTRGGTGKLAADTAVGKLRSDEVEVAAAPPEVYGKPCLMLAAAGRGDVFAGELLALCAHGAIPNCLLLAPAAPSGDGHDVAQSAYRADACLQKRGGAALEAHGRVAERGGKLGLRQ